MGYAACMYYILFSGAPQGLLLQEVHRISPGLGIQLTGVLQELVGSV